MLAKTDAAAQRSTMRWVRMGSEGPTGVDQERDSARSWKFPSLSFLLKKMHAVHLEHLLRFKSIFVRAFSPKISGLVKSD